MRTTGTPHTSFSGSCNRICDVDFLGVFQWGRCTSGNARLFLQGIPQASDATTTDSSDDGQVEDYDQSPPLSSARAEQVKKTHAPERRNARETAKSSFGTPTRFSPTEERHLSLPPIATLSRASQHHWTRVAAAKWKDGQHARAPDPFQQDTEGEGDGDNDDYIGPL